MKRIKLKGKNLWRIIRREEMSFLPGNLAFFLVLSIIPILSLIGVVGSFFSISTASLVEFINGNLPEEISSLLVPFISGNSFDMNIALFMIFGFILASNGSYSIIVATNTLFEIKKRDSLSMRIKSIFVTILLISLILIILLVLAFGNMIVGELVDNTNRHLYYLFNIFKWPITFAVIFITMKIIYVISPTKKIASKFFTKGAIFTTIGVTIVTAIYSFYIETFASYDIFYGGLSNIASFMMWVYILSYIIVIGIAINSNVYKMIEDIKKQVE